MIEVLIAAASFLLGIMAGKLFDVLYESPNVEQPCRHDYAQWGRTYEAKNYLLQESYCDKCGVVKVHKIKVG